MSEYNLIISQGKAQHGHYSNQTFTIGGWKFYLFATYCSNHTLCRLLLLSTNLRLQNLPFLYRSEERGKDKEMSSQPPHAEIGWKYEKMGKQRIRARRKIQETFRTKMRCSYQTPWMVLRMRFMIYLPTRHRGGRKGLCTFRAQPQKAFRNWIGYPDLDLNSLWN